MADEHVSRIFSENPDPQVNQVSGDDITPSQEQQPLTDSLPQSLIEWLARINRRYLVSELSRAGYQVLLIDLDTQGNVADSLRLPHCAAPSLRSGQGCVRHDIAK